MTTITRRAVLAAAGATAALGATRALAQGKTTITFAAATFAEAGRGDKLKAWIEKFNTSQDKVEVQPVAIPFSQLANTVFTQMGGGGGPDLVRFDQTDFFAALPAKRILPIDDLVDASKYTFQAPDKFLNVEGKRYGVVFELANYQLIYNPALLKGGEPPKTFPEFLAAAKEATGKGNFGYAFRATMPERSGFWQDLTNYVYGFGGNWADGKQLTLNSPKVVEAITAYKQVYDAGVIPKGADAATYRRMFWEGKIAMNIDNGGVAGIFAAQNPNLGFKAAPSPFPNRQQGLILTSLSVNANTKNKEACGVFVNWMLQPAAQAELQGILGAASVATPVERPKADLERAPWLAVYDAQTPYALPQLVLGFETKTLEIQQIVVEQVLKILVGNADVRKTLDEAQSLALKRIERQ